MIGGMKNEIKRTISGVIFQAENALPGIVANQEKLGLTLVNAVTFQARLEQLKADRDTHAKAKVILDGRRKALRGTVKECRGLGMLAKEVLNLFLGDEHSEAHEAAGYAGGMRIPRSYPGLMRMLQGLETHLKKCPAHEVAQLNVTAARAKELLDALTNALTSLNKQRSTVRELMKVRDGSALLVRKDLSALLAEIRIRAGTTASVWDDFGFKRPGILSTPEVPENVVVQPLGDDGAMVTCDRAPRGRRYQLWEKVEGVNEDFVLVETRKNRKFGRYDLPSGAEVLYAIVAVNNGGESRRSEPVKVKLPDAKAPKSKLQDPEKLQEPSSTERPQTFNTEHSTPDIQ
jgi:hypothetical protein